MTENPQIILNFVVIHFSWLKGAVDQGIQPLLLPVNARSSF
jgi:hypothetical protein